MISDELSDSSANKFSHSPYSIPSSPPKTPEFQQKGAARPPLLSLPANVESAIVPVTLPYATGAYCSQAPGQQAGQMSQFMTGPMYSSPDYFYNTYESPYGYYYDYPMYSHTYTPYYSQSDIAPQSHPVMPDSQSHHCHHAHPPQSQFTASHFGGAREPSYGYDNAGLSIHGQLTDAYRAADKPAYKSRFGPKRPGSKFAVDPMSFVRVSPTKLSLDSMNENEAPTMLKSMDIKYEDNWHADHIFKGDQWGKKHATHRTAREEIGCLAYLTKLQHYVVENTDKFEMAPLPECDRTRCTYAHPRPAEELLVKISDHPHVLQNRKKPYYCVVYALTGECSFHERCHYVHDMPAGFAPVCTFSKNRKRDL